MNKSKIILNKDNWYCPEYDTLNYQYTMDQIDTPARILKYVGGRKVCVHAGGNSGIYTKQFAASFERVYVFEPEPINFACLTLNVLMANVFKYQCCLGRFHRLTEMCFNPTESGAHKVMESNGIIPILKIDDFSLDACDLIHLDIEGYECYAIEGAIQTIIKYKPIICLEFCWTKNYIWGYLEALGYRFIEDINGDRLMKYFG